MWKQSAIGAPAYLQCVRPPERIYRRVCRNSPLSEHLRIYGVGAPQIYGVCAPPFIPLDLPAHIEQLTWLRGFVMIALLAELAYLQCLRALESAGR